MENYPEVNRWFSSELIFHTQADMVKCYKELKASISREHEITIESGNTGVHFSGLFDFSEFDEQFPHILSKYLMPMRYKVKCVFNDPNGYFGGWVTCWNTNAVEIESISLNEFFEREGNHGLSYSTNS